MKLYELDRFTYFTINGDEEKVIYKLHHIDGMYSYCTRESDKKVIHFAAWTEVEKIYV